MQVCAATSSKQRRSLLRASTALFAAANVPKTLAQEAAYPNRPIQIIVPFPAGNSSDALIRTLAQRAREILGQSIVVANIPGAGGTLAPGNMARTAKPDGYTLCFISSSSVLRVPYLETRNYDPEKDFSYVINLLNYSNYGIVVPAQSPWQSVADVIAAAKTKQVNWGGIGVNSSGHIGVMLLSRAAGFPLQYIPYRGGTDLTTNLLGGHVDVMGDTGWTTLVEGGKLRLLAMMSESRSPKFPEVPTLRELGYDVQASTRFGLVGPAGMAAQTVKILHDAFLEASKDARFQDAAKLYDVLYAPMRTADYTRWAHQQIALEKRQIETLGLRNT